MSSATVAVILLAALVGTDGVVVASSDDSQLVRSVSNLVQHLVVAIRKQNHKVRCIKIIR
jgi:predicted SpoU family rRNA methylase